MRKRSPLACVYCGHPATTNDHVIPRCLLEKPFPPNLPTVPSCQPCNEAYSRDEQYFLAVMAQVGCTSSLQSKVEDGGVVDRMLQRSVGLDTHFLENMGVAEDGGVFITPDEARIANIMQKAAFGLYCHRYTPQVIPPLKAFLALKPIHASDRDNFIVMMAHTERFRPRQWKHVQTLTCPNNGKVQVFDYMFVRNWIWRDFGRLFCIMRFHETIWAAVRCPYPPNRKNAKRRVGVCHSGQGLLWNRLPEDR